MTDTYPMTAADVTPMVDRAYAQGQTFGWVRETYVNAVQAGASRVEFTTEWTAVEALGVHRRVIFDDGLGMRIDDLPAYLNTWGGSGQVVGGLNENYGYGSKVSLLPWNAYGVVVLSRRDGETSMVWLHRGEDGKYGIRPLPHQDDQGVERDVKVVPLSEYDDYSDPDDGRLDWVQVMNVTFGALEHGTAIVLLGGTGREDTAFEGDPSRKEYSKFGIAQYLNSRFFQLPVPVRIDPLYPSDRDSWPSRYGSKNESRVAHGLGETIELGANDGIESGVVELVPDEPGALAARAYWWLAGKELPTAGDRNVLPLFGYRFRSHAGLDEIYSLETGYKSALLSSLVAQPAVRRRVGILFEPLEDEAHRVYPAGTSRAGLQFDIAGGGGGHDLPFMNWRNSWLRRIPDTIRDAILEALPKDETAPSVEASIRSWLSKEFLPYLRSRQDVFVADDAAELQTAGEVDAQAGPREESGVRRRRHREVERDSPTPSPIVPPGEDEAPASLARRQAGLVEVDFESDRESPFAVRYDATAGVQRGFINRESESYRRALDYVTAKYRAQGRVGPEEDSRSFRLRQLMEQAMKTQVTTALTELLATADADKANFDAYMAPASCSATLMGLNWLSQALSRSVPEALPVLSSPIGDDEEVSTEDAQ